ncbi:hypothetical protein MHTCC0001_09160 [Flavobacteriaceae bacterium MHTCC 0001]
MTKYIYLVVLLIGINITKAQEIRYVNADNGLFLRHTPNPGSKHIGKLAYGTTLLITERTNLKLDITDNDRIVSGEWVKVTCTDDLYNHRTGYVFNGFLSEEKLHKRFSVGFEDFTVEFNDVDAEIIGNPQITIHDSNTIDAFIEFGETVEDKSIRIRHHSKYKSIKVYQRHENSIAIGADGPQCVLDDWKHFYSAWEPLKTDAKSNLFKTITYGKKASNKFIEVDMNECKERVKTHCGDAWYDLIKEDKKLKKDAIVISKIYFKVIFTTMDDKTIEKVIAFDVPLGC